jgi:hypothetical protein
MRFRGAGLVILIGAAVTTLLCGLAGAQTAAPAAAPARTTARAAGSATLVQANLAQLMRGILFPNSNVIFFAQSNDPAAVKPAEDPSMSTDPLTNSYGGWLAVENSALALSEAARLLTIPGRLCSNGRAVPLKNPDWAKFAQQLRDAGMTAYKAAQSKNQDKMLDAADVVATACANCHDRYREKPGGVPDRCM